MLDQLASNIVRFHGIEWDFQSLEVEEALKEGFLARFGPRQADQTRNLEDMMRSVYVAPR